MTGEDFTLDPNFNLILGTAAETGVVVEELADVELVVVVVVLDGFGSVWVRLGGVDLGLDA